MKSLRLGLIAALLTTMPAVMAADNDLAHRLQVLEDKEAIRILLLNYGRYVDDRNWQAFADLFADDGGSWNGGMGVATGHDAIIKMMTDTIGTTNAGASGGLSNLHLLTNEIIEVNGDTATALSKWAFVMTAEGTGPDVVYIGRYHDKLVREDGEWKFKERVVAGDVMRTNAVESLNAAE